MSSDRLINQLIASGDLVLYHDYRSGSLRDWSGRGNDGVATAACQWMNKRIHFPLGACVQTPAIDLTSTNNISLVMMCGGWLPIPPISGAFPQRFMAEFSPDFNANTDSFVFYMGPSNYIVAAIRGDVGVSGCVVQPAAVAIREWGNLNYWAFNFDKGAAAALEGIPYLNGLAVPFDPAGGPANNTNNFGIRALNIGSQNNGALYSSYSVISVVMLTKRKLLPNEHVELYSELKEMD